MSSWSQEALSVIAVLPTPGSPSRPTDARLAAPGTAGPPSEPTRAACRSRPAAAERE